MRMLIAGLIGFAAQGAAADAPIYFTSFTHMEGSYTYQTAAGFADTATRLRWAMGVSEEYGYRLTIESEKSFAIACVTYSDFGMTSPLTTPQQYSLNFIQNKQRVDTLVGIQANMDAFLDTTTLERFRVAYQELGHRPVPAGTKPKSAAKRESYRAPKKGK